MKSTAVLALALCLATPALATDEEPAPTGKEIAALMEARDAQAQRHVAAQSLPRYLGYAATTASIASLFGVGLAIGGSRGDTPESMGMAFTGCGLFLCGVGSSAVVGILSLVLDKRAEEAQALDAAQAKLDAAVKRSIAQDAQAY